MLKSKKFDGNDIRFHVGTMIIADDLLSELVIKNHSMYKTNGFVLIHLRFIHTLKLCLRFPYKVTKSYTFIIILMPCLKTLRGHTCLLFANVIYVILEDVICLYMLI